MYMLIHTVLPVINRLLKMKQYLLITSVAIALVSVTGYLLRLTLNHDLVRCTNLAFYFQFFFSNYDLYRLT